jgi:branched-chain amino acid transport system permease protein
MKLEEAVRERLPAPRAALSPLLGLALAAVIVLVVVLYPVVNQNAYQLRVAANLFLNVSLVVGLWVVYATGLLNMGQIAFMGIGGYTAAALALHQGWSFWALLPAGMMTATIVGLVIGHITLRLRGAYFFLVSFAFLEITRLFFTSFLKDVFGGTDGLVAIPVPPNLGIVNLATPTGHYYMTMGLMFLSVGVVWRVIASRNGLILRALGQSESLAESVGINAFWYRLVTFLMSCALAGLAGVVYAHLNLVVFPSDISLSRAVLVVVHMVVGGVGHILGPVLGAAVLTALGEWLRRFGTAEQLAYGAMLILVMLAIPGGFISLPGRLGQLLAATWQAVSGLRVKGRKGVVADS